MSEAKSYLMQIGKLDRLIINKQWEIARMLHAAEGMTGVGADVIINGEKHAMDKVQSSGNPQRMADAVCAYLDVQEKALLDIARWQAEQQEIISIIEPLPEKEYRLLHGVYVQGKSLADIAEDFGRTYSWATTIHGVALKRVQDALDKKHGGGDGG